MKEFLYPKNVLDLFERTVEMYPDRPAIRDEAETLTYAQLQARARRFGAALSGCRAETGLPVVLFLDKSCACFAAMLGVLYSGKIYVPMDVKTSADRLASIRRTLGDHVIVADQSGRDALAKIGFAESVLEYEMLAAEDAQAGTDPATEQLRNDIRARALDTDLMYILFTSGSTGDPKGVAVSHRAVLDYIRAFTAQVPITGEDVLGNQAPFYVDMSLKDLYMGIAVGACICVIPPKYFMTPKKLLTWLDDHHVTMLMWVPTAYGIIARFKALDKVCPTGIRKILFSGEGMPIPVFRYWKAHYPDAVYIQQYGPTEITGACTNFIIDRDYEEQETIPIGRPFDNTGLILLDEEDRLIPDTVPDVPGEICVYGSCLASGYYHDPEKTAAAFVQNPLVKTHCALMYRTGDLARYDAEGNLVFLSRKDYQIKHGGRRIELGEIETGIYTVEEIAACCCVHNEKEDVICAFYVGEIGEGALRSVLRDRLPSYMIPTRCVRLESLPKLESGKLDRKRMKQMAEQEEEA